MRSDVVDAAVQRVPDLAHPNKDKLSLRSPQLPLDPDRPPLACCLVDERDRAVTLPQRVARVEIGVGDIRRTVRDDSLEVARLFISDEIDGAVIGMQRLAHARNSPTGPTAGPAFEKGGGLGPKALLRRFSPTAVMAL